jgi:phosphoenolpyruvate-protein kinase (PTS system EI component)
MNRIRATPFVPGRARGVLRGPGSGAGPGAIVLVKYEDLAGLGGRPEGLVVVDGPPFSHPMIRLLGRGIPSVIVTPAQAAALRIGTELAFDGAQGWIDEAGADEEPEAQPSAPQAGAPVMTADGQAVGLRASVADVQAAARAVACGASAVGLIRSEYLTPQNGRLPDCAFYTRALGALCEAARPLHAQVRLLDLAADKRPAWLPPLAGLRGSLGLQGSRLFAIEPVRSAFHAEVEAVARLATRFDLSLILPYVVRPQDFRRWRQEIAERISSGVPVGVMAESPAACLSISEWLGLADFVAIGCNDLMQCLFAADRDIPQVAHCLDPYAPALFRMLRYVAELAGGRTERIQLCGLLPRVTGVLPVLLGLGYRLLSVDPILIPYLAQTVRWTDARKSEALAHAVCAAPDSHRVCELLGAEPGQIWALGSAG